MTAQTPGPDFPEQPQLRYKEFRAKKEKVTGFSLNFSTAQEGGLSVDP